MNKLVCLLKNYKKRTHRFWKVCFPVGLTFSVRNPFEIQKPIYGTTKQNQKNFGHTKCLLFFARCDYPIEDHFIDEQVQNQNKHVHHDPVLYVFCHGCVSCLLKERLCAVIDLNVSALILNPNLLAF